MSTLQQMLAANRWLDLAISKNKLGFFVIGIPPYAQYRTNDVGVREAILEPNLQSLYHYYERHKELSFDKDVENAIYQLIETDGNKDFMIYQTLMFITMQLEHEKRRTAKFSLDCTGILDAIRQKINENKHTFKKPSDAFAKSVWPEIKFYDAHITENYNQHVL